jgi:hypothetical protein
MKKLGLLMLVLLFGWSINGFPAYVGNWSFLSINGPYKFFNEKDFEIFKASAREALDNQKDGETISWKNSASGANGTHRIVGSFNRDGQKCRRLEMFSRAAEKQARISFNFCLQPDDTWHIAK